MSAPGYQTIVNEQIPVVQLDRWSRFASCDCWVGGRGKRPGQDIHAHRIVRFAAARGAFDAVADPERLQRRYVSLSGQASVEGSHRLTEAELAVFTSTEEPVTIIAEEDARFW